MSDLISISEYAKLVGVSPDTVRQKILRENINATKIGRNWVIDKNEPYVDSRVRKEERKMVKYKTKKNLNEVWQQLDDACGLIENATTNLAEMSNLPKSLKDTLDQFDFGVIVSLKNEVEELMDKDK
jgi:excisionase family DNA binding protein